MQHPSRTPVPPVQDMSPSEFRNNGYAVIDWIADYLEAPDKWLVLPDIKPGDLRASLPPSPPDRAESMEAILADFKSIIVPANTHWNHPDFLAYFANSATGAGVLGEALSATLNVNAMLWRTSPAATELELLTLDWLRQMIGLPAGFFGVISDTASSNTLYALTAARELHPELRIREEGMAGRSELRLDVKALSGAVEHDLRTGHLPLAVVATVGTTSTTAIDPVADIADICQRQKIWLHVDASYGGVAAILPEMRWILDGCDRADSLVINPHKWLFTPMDCSALYTRRPELLKRAFQHVPDYLGVTESDGVANL